QIIRAGIKHNQMRAWSRAGKFGDTIRRPGGPASTQVRIPCPLLWELIENGPQVSPAMQFFTTSPVLHRLKSRNPGLTKVLHHLERAQNLSFLLSEGCRQRARRRQ